jgi:hypothetical protein
MSTSAESFGEIKRPWQWIAAGGVVLLIWAAIALTTQRSSKVEPFAMQTTQLHQAPELYASAAAQAGPVSRAQGGAAMSAALVAAPSVPDAAFSRRIMRTSSLELVVQDPAEMARRITALAESFGGYLVSAQGGQSATTSMLTIRVPAARFEQTRDEIRKLGMKVENERVDAEDVTRQYVDQDANLRNLRAEETQYLTILKQANTVKDMLAVSERLSDVRGQIERQQAEFNTLSQQIETVAITISLRAEAQAEVWGLNWRPGYQLRLALRDGLDSLATYSAAMVTILSYLPATLLWAGTILVSALAGWRIVSWIGRRWFGWASDRVATQG